MKQSLNSRGLLYVALCDIEEAVKAKPELVKVEEVQKLIKVYSNICNNDEFLLEKMREVQNILETRTTDSGKHAPRFSFSFGIKKNSGR